MFSLDQRVYVQDLKLDEVLPVFVPHRTSHCAHIIGRQQLLAPIKMY